MVIVFHKFILERETISFSSVVCIDCIINEMRVFCSIFIQNNAIFIFKISETEW